MPFWKRWRIFWCLWTAVWLVLILLRPDYRTLIPHDITGEMYFHRQLVPFADVGGGLCFFANVIRPLIAVCVFSAAQSRVLADRRAAARRLSGAVRVGGHAQRQHRILHGFIRRATGLFGAICGASLFLCACQKYIMLRQISGAGCLPTRRFYMKGF